MPEEEGVEATLENRDTGCRFDVSGQSVPNVGSSNR